MKLKELLAKKEQKRAALVAKSNASDNVAELRSINVELDELNLEISDLKDMIAEEEARSVVPNGDPIVVVPNAEQRSGDPIVGFKNVATFKQGEESRNEVSNVAKLEKMGATLRSGERITADMSSAEMRATTVGGGTLIVETKYSREIAPTFNEVSSLLEQVNSVPLIGGESYEKGFVKSTGEGDYTVEGEASVDADPLMDYVSVGRALITAYAEVTKEVLKLPNANYVNVVVESVKTAIRKKIAKQILVGAGTANTITGIFKAPVNVIPLASDLDIDDIDETTLGKIVLAYGGDEDIEGGAVLIINKKTLTSFANVRSTDGKAIYKIKMDTTQNSGTISSDESWNVPFILNSAAPAFSAAAEDAYFGAYGKPACYELPIFSQLEISESKDYKFKTRQIAYQGEIIIGGNVGAYKGFMRLKKNAVA